MSNQLSIPISNLPTVEDSLFVHLPTIDHIEYTQLKTKHREAVYSKLNACHCIDILTGSHGFTQAQAIDFVLKRATGLRGLSKPTLNKLYPIWKHGGQKQNANGKPAGTSYKARSWRIFAPNYTSGTDGQPPEFVKFYVALYMKTDRADTFDATRLQLLDLWRQNEHIPGYGTRYEWCAAQGRPVSTSMILRTPDYPVGWSKANLSRILSKHAKKQEIQLIRRGEHHQHHHWGDQLLRDRSNLKPLQLVTYDDVRCDIKVLMYDGNAGPRVVEPEALFSIDVATGYILNHGVKESDTRTEDEGDKKAGTKRALDPQDTKFIFLKNIETYGLPDNYISGQLFENQTAKMAKDDRAEVLGLLTGCVKFDFTGMIRSQILKDGFKEGGGMPWQKGWVESLFRLLQTRMNHLKGTIGSRYQLTSGTQADRESKALATLKQALGKGINPEQMRLQLYTAEQFKTILKVYVDLLNWRTEHKLQGYPDIFEYELSPGDWIRSDDPVRAHLIPLGAKLFPRKEAPIERFQRLYAANSFSHPLPEVLLPLYQHRRKVKVRHSRIQFTDKKLATDPLIFRYAEPRLDLDEYEGHELIAYVHDDLEFIFLATLEYQPLGAVHRQHRIDMTDEHAMERGIWATHRGRESQRAKARRAAEPIQAELAEDNAHNQRLLNEFEPNLGNRIQEATTETKKRTAKKRSFEQMVHAADDCDLSEILDQPTENEDSQLQQDIDDMAEFLSD